MKLTTSYACKSMQTFKCKIQRDDNNEKFKWNDTYVERTWRATWDWLYCPRLPQSPTTRKLREPSGFGACLKRWSSAAQATKQSDRRHPLEWREEIMALWLLEVLDREATRDWVFRRKLWENWVKWLWGRAIYIYYMKFPIVPAFLKEPSFIPFYLIFIEKSHQIL